MIRLLYVSKTVQEDITAKTGSYRRSDNIDSLGMEFCFEMAYSQLDENFCSELMLGGKVILVNNDAIVFTGIIFKADKRLGSIAYTCFDYGIYLNKSEALIQFNKTSTSDALRRLCQENNIPVGSICNISTVVSKIYNGDTLADIIKDLLNMAGNELAKNYRLEIRNNLLYIEKYEDLVLVVKNEDQNLGSFDVTKVIGDYSCSESIENMKNRIIVSSSNEKNTQILAQEEDSGSQNTFGLLTKVEKVDDKNQSQARNIAKNKLLELNKVTKTFSAELLGNDLVRSGRMLIFSQPELGMTGAYLVRACTHTYDGNKHLMRLELEV